MGVNDMTFEQAATVLDAIYKQASGQSVLGAITTNNFVSVAQTALKTGYDPLSTAISQVLSRTIFSIRPYTAKFKGLFTSPERYGNHVRKINYVDGAIEDDQRFSLVNGQSVDHYRVNSCETVQTNFYGANTYQRHTTIYKDQLDNAFSSASAFSQFITGQLQNVSDQLEQVREQYARMTLCNFIAAKAYADSGNILHLVTAYNAEAGTSLTSQTVLAPANFVPFVKWLYGYIQTLAEFMSERSVKYHQLINGKAILRHTPLNRMKAYINTQFMNNIDSSVLSSVFHDERLKMIDYEPVNYWQSIDNPMNVTATPAYMASDGTVVEHTEPVACENILGVMFDDEAAGVTLVNQWSATTPLNAAGGYTNTYWHETVRFWNDFSENFVVLALD